jgi:riboflavin-specific deaminase-like protein
MRVVFPVVTDVPDTDRFSVIDGLYPWPETGTWVRANMVTTVDGRSQGGDGLSGQISPAADKDVFLRLRATADVVLVGAQTARSENYGPVAASDGSGPDAVRLAVVSGQLNLDPGDRLFDQPENTDGSLTARTLVLTTRKAPHRRRDELAEVAEIVICGEERVDSAAMMAALNERNLPRIHCEGGPTLLNQLISDHCVNELDITIAPVLVGGGALGLLADIPLPGASMPLELAHIIQADSALLLRYLITMSHPHIGR